ncbi:MAG: hypothetical protein AAF632_15680 [Bacteroidota bacterium]
MKRVIHFCISWLLLNLSGCAPSGDRLVLPDSRLYGTNITVTPSEVYPFLIQLLAKSPQAYPHQDTNVIRETGLAVWVAYVYRLLQSQAQLDDPNYYLHWYEDHLSYTCAFTSMQQEEGATSIQWDYNQAVCNRSETPQSGFCTLTVYQQSGMVHARFEYDQIAFGSKVISGHHSFRGSISPNGSLYDIREALHLTQ